MPTECGHTANELHLMVDLTPNDNMESDLKVVSKCPISSYISWFCENTFANRSPVPDSSAPVPRFPALRGCFCDGLADVGYGTWADSRPDVWSQWWGGEWYRGGCTEILPLVADQSELNLDCEDYMRLQYFNIFQPGWWFGTWLLFFPSYWEFHTPNWRTPSFFRGVATTNQQHISTIPGRDGRLPLLGMQFLEGGVVATWLSVGCVDLEVSWRLER